MALSMRREAILSAPFVAMALLWACHANPSIDGTKVPKIGSEAAPPSCPALCDRLAKLCGYAPFDCVNGCADYDEDHRACIGQAANCQAALTDCTNAEEPDAGDEAGDEAGSDDDGGDDAGSD
jgi:hypothetical protein